MSQNQQTPPQFSTKINTLDANQDLVIDGETVIDDMLMASRVAEWETKFEKKINGIRIKLLKNVLHLSIDRVEQYLFKSIVPRAPSLGTVLILKYCSTRSNAWNIT